MVVDFEHVVFYRERGNREVFRSEHFTRFVLLERNSSNESLMRRSIAYTSSCVMLPRSECFERKRGFEAFCAMIVLYFSPVSLRDLRR